LIYFLLSERIMQIWFVGRAECGSEIRDQLARTCRKRPTGLLKQSAAPAFAVALFQPLLEFNPRTHQSGLGRWCANSKSAAMSRMTSWRRSRITRTSRSSGGMLRISWFRIRTTSFVSY
jgi:hypothetical protein